MFFTGCVGCLVQVRPKCSELPQREPPDVQRLCSVRLVMAGRCSQVRVFWMVFSQPREVEQPDSPSHTSHYGVRTFRSLNLVFTGLSFTDFPCLGAQWPWVQRSSTPGTPSALASISNLIKALKTSKSTHEIHPTSSLLLLGPDVCSHRRSATSADANHVCRSCTSTFVSMRQMSKAFA